MVPPVQKFTCKMVFKDNLSQDAVYPGSCNNIMTRVCESILYKCCMDNDYNGCVTLRDKPKLVSNDCKHGVY